MKLGLAVAGLVLVGLFRTAPAAALTLQLAKSAPAVVGQPRTYQLQPITDAVGTVTLRWYFTSNDTSADENFVSDPTTDRQATHTFLRPGHYTVRVNATDDLGGTSVVSQELAHNALTPVPPSNSSTILLDAERHQVWTTNPDSDTVSVFDQVTLTRVREVPVGHEPHSIAQAPDKSIWVTDQQSDEVVVLDRDTGAVQTRIALPYASEPRSVAFGPSGNAYVSLYATGKLIEIDAASRKLGRELALGPTPYGVAVAADGRVFVTRFNSPVDHGEVWVVSPQSFTLVNTIRLPFDTTQDTQSSGRGVPNDIFSMTISPDGLQAFVVAKKDNVARGRKRDGQPMTFDNFVRTAVCKIDMKTETEIVAQRQDIDNRSLLVSVAFSSYGDYAFILALGNNWFVALDTYTTALLGATRFVGHGPDGLALTPDGKLFVNASLSREVIAYDVTAILDSSDQAAPPRLATIPATDHDKLTPQLLTGKQIFYNSDDTRMGHAGYWSCASCHFAGISDGRVWDFSDRGEGLRNTKTLLGIRGAQGQGRVHWSANMDEIQDFERDIRRDFAGSGFMSDADYEAHLLPDGTYDTLGKPSAGVSPDLDALAAYVTSLAEVARSPFRNPDGSFTRDALAGRQIFERSGCPACHNGPDFTDSARGMLYDVGTILPSSGDRLFQPLAGLDTPTLKGLWQSAPYLHDGRAATLAEVFTKYNPNDRMGVTSHLSPSEINQLVEYLLELDDVPVTETTGNGGAANGSSTAQASAHDSSGICSVGSVGSGRRAPLAAWAVACSVLVALRRRTRYGARAN